MTTPSPSFASTYPPEIVEWVEALYSADPSPAHRRALAILEDDEVMRVVQRVLPSLLANTDQWHDEDRLTRLDAFWAFINEAAALPEQQIPGAHLRAPGELPIFSTPAQLRKDITKAADEALTLAERLTRIATTIQGEMPLNAVRQAIESLDAVYIACINTAHHHAPNKQTRGVPDFPFPGSKAGKSAARNWLIHEVGKLALYHLRDRSISLVVEVVRVLMDHAEPAEHSTAREFVPKTRLVSAEGDLAIDEDWKAKLGL